MDRPRKRAPVTRVRPGPYPGARRRNGATETPVHPHCTTCQRPTNRWGGTCMDCRLAERNP